MRKFSEIDTIIVRQNKELLEAFTRYETRNTYNIYFDRDEAELFAGEINTGWLSRNILGNLRPFEIAIEDKEKNRIATLKRPFRFYFHELEIIGLNDEYLGKVKKKFSFFNRKFEIQDNDGNKVYEIHGPFFRPWTFRVKKSEEVVANIRKKWSGALKEMFTDADNFGLEILREMEVRSKFLLMGAIFLIDYMYFENNSSQR